LKKALLPLALCLVGCGVGFDPPFEVKGLRVLGVQKEPAYVAPGEEVTLRMLWHDGKEPGRDVMRLWLGGCFNPPGDFYYGCFPQLAEAFGRGALDYIALGDSFSFRAPDDLVEAHPSPASPDQTPYGVAVVFFAVCAGALDFVIPEDRYGFPLVCRGPQGELLGTEDFVAGYTTLFSYESLRNENPIVTGFELAGRPVAPDCIGEACLSASLDVDIDCDVAPERCIATCASNGDAACPGIAVRPLIDPVSAERNANVGSIGNPVGEQLWVNYFIDRGSLRSGIRLYADATTGIDDKYGTDVYAPSEPGLVRIWAVVHDNRGGTAWTRLTVRAR
jgi:hypothetical protein